MITLRKANFPGNGTTERGGKVSIHPEAIQAVEEYEYYPNISCIHLNHTKFYVYGHRREVLQLIR